MKERTQNNLFKKKRKPSSYNWRIWRMKYQTKIFLPFAVVEQEETELFRMILLLKVSREQLVVYMRIKMKSNQDVILIWQQMRGNRIQKLSQNQMMKKVSSLFRKLILSLLSILPNLHVRKFLYHLQNLCPML